jgi:hypothetical protein
MNVEGCGAPEAVCEESRLPGSSIHRIRFAWLAIRADSENDACVQWTCKGIDFPAVGAARRVSVGRRDRVSSCFRPLVGVLFAKPLTLQNLSPRCPSRRRGVYAETEFELAGASNNLLNFAARR